MRDALERFGLPSGVVEMVRSIYSARCFAIVDHAGRSSERRQHAGIAQGCPLSPYLFIIVQTVLLHDVYGTLELLPEPDFVITRDILYADDTLLVSHHCSNLQRMLAAIVEEGRKYGLELNWEKTVQIQISTDRAITSPSGEHIKAVRDAIYLGGLISCDGKVATELNRRLGEANRIFKQLHRIWSRTSIGKKRKIHIYESCVLNKLLYSLDYVWLLKADRARLDAFHCKCLRRLLGIRPSFLSRVSNAVVLQKASAKPLSQILLARQVALYSKIMNSSCPALVKAAVCNDDGTPKSWAGRRKRGRPRQQWASQVYKLSQHV